MSLKYTYNGKLVCTSADRIYTHAVGVITEDGEFHLCNRCGSLFLAEKALGAHPAQRMAKKYGVPATIVELQVKA